MQNDKHLEIMEKVVQKNTNSFIKKYVYTFEKDGKKTKKTLPPLNGEEQKAYFEEFGVIREMTPVELLRSDELV